jgi:hypothetical protein
MLDIVLCEQGYVVKPLLVAKARHQKGSIAFPAFTITQPAQWTNIARYNYFIHYIHITYFLV